MVAAAVAAATMTSLSEAFRDSHAVVHSHHIIPIDFTSLDHLPDTHAWSPSDTRHSCPANLRNSCCTVPVIDLTAPNAAEMVAHACENWGMFQLTEHGVPGSLIDEAEAQARRLFALPAEQKRKAMRTAGRATGYGAAPISPFFPKRMWHEGFTVMGSAVEHARRIWPSRYQEFCDAMDNYQKKMNSLAHKILVLSLKALGVHDDEQDRDSDTLFPSSSYISEEALQLNSYPSCPNPSRAIGLAPHTDTALLTILHQNDVNGLQVFVADKGWVSVPPVSGALVVNVGDLMHILSNASYPTVLHRVIPDETRHRVTMAYFCMPPADFIVAPLTQGLPCPRFRPVTVKEYMDLKYKHLEKALHCVRN